MSDELSEIRKIIRALLARISESHDDFDTVADTAALRRSGVSSIALVSLLVAMEDEFDFEWDDDIGSETLRSIDSLARHVAALKSESAGVAG